MARAGLLAGVLLVGLAGGALAQDKPAQPDPNEILKKSLALYSTAKSYDGVWSYTMDRGAAKQSAVMTIRCKGPTKLALRLAAVKAKTADSTPLDPIPELVVVVDGKTANFENAGTKEYFSVPMPKNGQVSPVMFFPQMQTVAKVERDDDVTADGKTLMVFRTQRSDGSTTRIEIDPANYRIRRIVSSASIGSLRLISVLSADKEVFDADMSDKEFAWKAPKGGKAIPVPPGTVEMFGVPDAPAASPAK